MTPSSQAPPSGRPPPLVARLVAEHRAARASTGPIAALGEAGDPAGPSCHEPGRGGGAQLVEAVLRFGGPGPHRPHHDPTATTRTWLGDLSRSPVGAPIRSGGSDADR